VENPTLLLIVFLPRNPIYTPVNPTINELENEQKNKKLHPSSSALPLEGQKKSTKNHKGGGGLNPSTIRFKPRRYIFHVDKYSVENSTHPKSVILPRARPIQSYFTIKTLGKNEQTWRTHNHFLGRTPSLP
jgi:hypothetical protein